MLEDDYLHPSAPLNDPIQFTIRIVTGTVFLAWSLIWVTGWPLPIFGLALLTARVDIVGHGP